MTADFLKTIKLNDDGFVLEAAIGHKNIRQVECYVMWNGVEQLYIVNQVVKLGDPQQLPTTSHVTITKVFEDKTEKRCQEELILLLRECLGETDTHEDGFLAKALHETSWSGWWRDDG